VGYDTIYDIKTTSSDYEIGKYFTSLQHKIYMLCSGINRFEYLLTKIKIKETRELVTGSGAEAVFSDIIEEITPLENFVEFYNWQDSYEADIYYCIKNLFRWLEIKGNEENLKTFENKWVCKY
jgi:hypothetical protein